jgi:hypothetical protein
MEYITQFIQENPLIAFLFSLLFFWLSLKSFQHYKELKSADFIIKNQHKIVPSELIAEFRSEAEKMGCLTEFNNELKAVGTPIKFFDLMYSFEKAMKEKGLEHIDGV